MTQENKELLFKDLSARLPYHVIVKVWLKDGTTEEGFLDLEHNYGDVLKAVFYYNDIVDIKPYLRSLSSITEEELEELNTLTYHNIRVQDNALCGYICGNELEDVFDWLNKKMFAYRCIDGNDMFELGLAIEAPEGMYKID